MEQLSKIALFFLKVYFNVTLWLIEAGMKYWRTILVAVVVGGIFFAAVYFYNFYTLKVPSRNLILTLIVSQRIEKDLTPDDHIIR
jgi:phosphoglycerol transferase MdoB-like AlkP superfamily enzyme